MTGLLQAAIQFLTENQGWEAAEDVTPNGLIELMIDGTGVKD